ncbi:MAG: hypothetical protein ACOYB3_01210 [Azonexus sp.]
MSDTPKQDVVIYEIETRIVESVVGRNLDDKGFHTVDKRVETVAGRLNDRFDVMAVPAGKYDKGSVLPDEP